MFVFLYFTISATMHPNEPLSKKLSLWKKKSVQQLSHYFRMLFGSKEKRAQKKPTMSMELPLFFLLRPFLLFFVIWSINWSFFSYPVCYLLLFLFAIHNYLDCQFFAKFCHPAKSFPEIFLVLLPFYFPSK